MLHEIAILKEGSREYERLVGFAKLLESKLSHLESGIKCNVGDTYWDFGAGIMWTTIIVEYSRDWGNHDRTTYQLLYPKQWDKIISGNLSDFTETLKEYVAKMEERGW